MPNRKAEPGVWGSCICDRWHYDAKTGQWVPQRTWQTPREGGFHCRECGDQLLDGGHVRPNLWGVAEEMLAEALGTQAQAQAQQKLGSINYHDWMQAAAIERVLRRLFARVANCPTCGGTGYVEGEPCAECQPDAKEEG